MTPHSLESALSIVVPVHNDACNLVACLAALQRAGVQPLEVIVVDDASVVDVSSIANEAGARYVRLAKQVGPAGARNAGWRAAQGEIVLFIDSDVVVSSDAIHGLLQRFRLRPDVIGVFGSYDDSPAGRSFYSQFRNLLHHYIHQTSSEEACTFWTGFGAIRRSALETAGGFNEQIAGLEDVELGMRLSAGGAKFYLDKSLQVKHLKNWTLTSMVSTDIFRRAVPWAQLLLAAERVPADLNLTYAARFSALLVAALIVTTCLLVGVALHWLGWRLAPLVFSAAVLIACLVALNRRFYTFLSAKHGFVFACISVLAHWLFYLYSGATFAVMWIAHSSRLWNVRLRSGD